MEEWYRLINDAMTDSIKRFPEPVLTSLRDRRLVVFAGAGVSMGKPACLPSFRELADSTAAGTGLERSLNETDDAFLGRLQHQGVSVHDIAASKLRENCHGEAPEPTDLHQNLLRLYPDPASVRIVTTNFDLLFSDAAKDQSPEVPEMFRAPALPLGREFNGIVHVHGCMDRPREMVLTDADFGRAYLTEGWARRFLVEMFHSFTVLFVGYRHEDTVMKYHARALPASESGRRFILTDKADHDQWSVLGIQPIFYPKESSNDYSQLYKGVQNLAEYVRRGLLDWRREITEVARKAPSLDEREAEVIEEALRDTAKTRFFIEAANDPEWITWLEGRGHLNPLFGPGELQNRDSILINWLVDKFAFNCPEALFLMFGRHGMSLHPNFWHALIMSGAYRDDPPMDKETLSRWVSCLISTAPPHQDLALLTGLARRCNQLGLMESTVEIFDAMASHSLFLRPAFLWFEDESADTLDSHWDEIDIVLTPESENSAFRELWNECLQPRLDQVAGPVLSIIVAQLEARHRKFLSWTCEATDWDPESQGRNAIGTDEQTPGFNHVDVLIDAAVDCLQWFVCHQPEVAARWCDQLAESSAPLLRRLGMYTLSARKDINAKEKFDWVFEKLGLNDVAVFDELSQGMQEIYPHVNRGRREQAISTILTHRFSHDEDGQDRHRGVRQRFDWLQLLRDADTDCLITQQAVEDFLRENPEFTPPEDNISSPSEYWNVNYLLSRSPGDWLDEFLAAQLPNPHDPTYEAPHNGILGAARKQFKWGADLSRVLIDRELWDAEIWRPLFRAWREGELTSEQLAEVFTCLGDDGLSKAHSVRVADLLLGWLEKDDTLCTGALLSQANVIATRLWEILDRDEAPGICECWYSAASGRPAGILARYWLRQRSMLHQWSDPVPQPIIDEVREALSTIMQDTSCVGYQGSAVLAAQLGFLLDVEEQWTLEKLIPRFSQNPRTDNYWSVWDGFLRAGSLTPSLGPLLKDAFFDAIPSIQSRILEKDWRSDLFVAQFVGMLAYFADDPVGEWVPAFFSDATRHARKRLTLEIERHLRYMDDNRQRDWWDRWLRHYWENRLSGVPKPLEDYEIRQMFRWLPYLETLFPDAVELAKRMKPVPIRTSHVIKGIAQGEHWKTSPKAVADLLIHLGEHASPGPVWQCAGKLVENLLRSDLSEDIQRKLNELLVKLGHDVS